MKQLNKMWVLLLLPIFSMAQHKTPSGIYDAYAKYLSSSPAKLVRNLPAAEKLRSLYLITGSRRDTFSTQTNGWSATDSVEFLYYATDSILLSQNHLVNDPDSGWINYLVNYYLYDDQKRDTLITIQEWDNDLDVYNYTQKFTYAYDANSNLLQSSIYNWNSGGLWDNSTQIVNDYDANDNLVKTTFLNWNGTSWDSSNQFVYSYDANNNQATETDYIYNAGWLPTYKYGKSYNVSNLEIQNIAQYWSTGGGGSWKNSAKDTLEYDANNNYIYFERKDWKASAQTFSLTDSKTEYLYNGENQLTGRTDYNGDGATSYTPSANYVYDYDADGNNTCLLEQIYNISTSSFDNYDRYYYYYTDELTGIPSVITNAYVAKLFPNPASDLLQLTMHLEHSADVQLELLDMNGHVIMQEPHSLIAGNNILKLDVSNLAKGVYTVRIFNPKTNAQSVNKFVKQ